MGLAWYFPANKLILLFQSFIKKIGKIVHLEEQRACHSVTTGDCKRMKAYPSAVRLIPIAYSRRVEMAHKE